MARETQKAKIERLENELEKANEIIQKLNNEIDGMINKADNSFENSSTYKQMVKQIETLELKVKSMMDSVEHNKKMYQNELKRNDELISNIQKLKDENEELKNNTNIHKIKNERGAGRKAKFTDEQIKEIKERRDNGHTIKEIAKEFKCSVGLVHKLISIKNLIDTEQREKI